MLYIAEGTIHRPLEGTEQTAASAWLGPMVDSGFLQSGYLDAARQRVFMVLSAPDAEAIHVRLGDLPIVQDGSVSFSVSHVTALRFS